MSIVSDRQILDEYRNISANLGDWTDAKGRSMSEEVYNTSCDFMRILNEISVLQSSAYNLNFLCEEAMQMGE